MIIFILTMVVLAPFALVGLITLVDTGVESGIVNLMTRISFFVELGLFIPLFILLCSGKAELPDVPVWGIVCAFCYATATAAALAFFGDR